MHIPISLLLHVNVGDITVRTKFNFLKETFCFGQLQKKKQTNYQNFAVRALQYLIDNIVKNLFNFILFLQNKMHY